MIIDSKGMKLIESCSGFSVSELMEKAGTAVADALFSASDTNDTILFLAGKGNNGGDAFVAARLLSKRERNCRVILMCGEPASDTAAANYRLLPGDMFADPANLDKELENADLIVDAVFGFGFRGSLDSDLKKMFRKVNAFSDKVYSIDVNSGAESDTDAHDSDAVRSLVTYALDCWKPTHMLRKEHRLFRKAELLSLSLPHDVRSPVHEMDVLRFLRNYPRKEESAHKGTFGRILLVSGGMGMAGAACLNLTGAVTAGASYIHMALPEEIYPICASRFITPVFHPFHYGNMEAVIRPLLRDIKAVGFGSGAVNMPEKEKCMELLLQNSTVPVVLDAEALRMLVQNTYLLRFIKCPLILTPHIGEFAALLSMPVHFVMDNKVRLARKFAEEYGVTVVLKGANTIVVAPGDNLYINQSGNPALAQAGSGDLLTGIITAMLSYHTDTFLSVCMAVWLHGYLADRGLSDYAVQTFPLESYPSLMNTFLKEHGY